MPYTVELSDRAGEQYAGWKEDNSRVADRIDRLLEAIEADPFEGIGKPKHLEGYWSRRITEKHRLLYEVKGERVNILSCYGHYKD
jgi:toxin YoeB